MRPGKLSECLSPRSRSFGHRLVHSDHGPRPPRMPKPVIDIKHIRQNPGLYELNCRQRNYPALAQHSWRILELHSQCRELQNGVLHARQELKRLENEIKLAVGMLAEANKSSTAEPVDDVIRKRDLAVEAKRPIQQQIDSLAPREREMQELIQELALALPNLSSQETPDGCEPEVMETIHAVQSRHNDSHESIGAELGILNFEAASSISGWGFYYLLGAGALLEQALVNHAMSIARAHGFTPVIPPSLVYSHAAWACGFRPRDEGGNKQIYMLETDENDDEIGRLQLALSGTAEIPLAGLYMNHTLTPQTLPLKHVGLSRSYRAEAGSRGKDTRGLYRVHEFTKVELFAWTGPDTSNAADDAASRFSATSPDSQSASMLQEILQVQRAILIPLNIPLRVLNQPATDLGASATVKYDIEGFFPSRTHAHWGELSSLSNCTDYQTRRLGTKLSTQHGVQWPHTLNGTALAVPRVLAALLENNWDPGRRVVTIPACLRQWMDGAQVIEPSRCH